MLSGGRIIASLLATRGYVRALNNARAELGRRLAAGPIENEQLAIHELVQKHVEPVLACHPTLAGDVRPIIRAREHLRAFLASARPTTN
jgi:hypothetical protein